jgi:hypothetical protein
MPRPARVAVPVAVRVAIWIATPSGAGNACTVPVSEVPFSGRQGGGSGKRAARGSPRARGRPERHGSLTEPPWVPRPFWVVLWDPFWRPLWSPLRTGSPSVAQNPCTAAAPSVPSSTRQPSGLRKQAVGGSACLGGAPCTRRLARAVDRCSHARPASRPDAGEEVSR